MVENLKNGKACGGDAIPNEALKATAQAMIAKLDTLYTCCIKLGYFPKVWKRAKVVWIPKPKGGYRPISLLPAFGRVLDKLLDNRLRDYIEKKSAISDNQFGFREGRDTTSAIKQLIQTINRKPPNHHALIVLLDLSNAFNMAWPPQVSEQLRTLRAPFYLQKIVASFLTDRIVYSGTVEMDMDIGCPQGSSMGPTLWIVAMQSWFRLFEDRHESTKVQAYADDQCLVLHGTSVKKIEAEWSKAWARCARCSSGSAVA